MDEQPTCGQGLAEHSMLPARLGELIASIAENLELHLKALDLTDTNARKEYDAYVTLATEHRTIASQLRATAEQMAGYRDLPMGMHDERAMSDPGILEAFERFVELERELLALLRNEVGRDQRILSEMRGITPPSGP